MDQRLRQLLGELHAFGVAHDAEKADRLERLRNVEPETAQLLAVLIRAMGARQVLELGTSNGYSTLWLADAARAVGGRVTSVELDPGRSSAAAENLQRGGVRELVDLHVADAGTVLAESPADAWDLIFLDAERPAYVSYWPDLIRVLRPGGLLVVDNVLSHPDQVADFRALVSADDRVSDVVSPTGAGALLVVREPAR